MHTGQSADDGRKIIAEKPTAIGGSKTRHGVMVVFVAEDDTFDGAFEFEHSLRLFSMRDV